MTIGVDAEDRELRDSVRGWAARAVGSAVIRHAVEAPRDERPSFWNALAEQGLLGIHLPEEVGGAGAGLLPLAVVVEELGRSLVPGPFLPTVTVGAVLHEAGADAFLGQLADGTMIAGIGTDPGTLRLVRDSGTATLTGTSGHIPGGQCADLVLVPARDGAGDATAWVLLRSDRVALRDLPGYDLLRRDAEFTVESLALDEDELLEVDAQRVANIVAALFAAEASGIADLCVRSAAEYARVRQQFGRAIGQFQGVKHSIARMLAAAEQTRAAAWDAVRAIGSATAIDEASFAAAVAAAVATESVQRCALDGLQVFDGIGYTWEHDAHLHLRRAQSLRLLLGGPQRWRRTVAALAQAGVRRGLEVELPPHAARIREEIRAELAPAAALTVRQRTDYLAEHGYTAPHLPRPWGKDADAVSQLVIAEELADAGLEPHDMIIGNWVVPTLLTHGDDAQVTRLVPPSLNGDVVWCQFFSEPDAGSDLASLKTSAVKVDGGWRISGQKVWTTMAHQAHWGICLARTDATAPKHAGMSYFLIDIATTPGLQIRPLRDITGESDFNEVFFDDAFVPDDCLVGRPGDGWRIARATLTNERVSLSGGTSIGAGGETLLRVARDVPGGLDEEQLGVLGTLLSDAQTLALMNLRTTLRQLSGSAPGAESSIAKLLSAEHHRHVAHAAMDWCGPQSLQGSRGRDDVQRRFLAAQCGTIAGGTTNVQLNIIGERLLGLPRDPEPGQ